MEAVTKYPMNEWDGLKLKRCAKLQILNCYLFKVQKKLKIWSHLFNVPIQDEHDLNFGLVAMILTKKVSQIYVMNNNKDEIISPIEGDAKNHTKKFLLLNLLL